MKKFISLCFVSVVGLFLGSSFINASDLDVYIELAKKQEKNVLVIFSLDNCKYCDLLKKDLDTIKYIDNYVVCVIDSRDNKKLTGKMDIKKWPTSVIMSVSKENQGEASRLVGYVIKSDYEQWLKANAAFFGKEDGCDCDKNCPCKKDGKCSCEKGKCKCKK